MIIEHYIAHFASLNAWTSVLRMQWLLHSTESGQMLDDEIVEAILIEKFKAA